MLPRPEWTPLRWPCGPLDIGLSKNKKDADTLRAWLRPEALDLVRDTPVNCLIVSWAANRREDSEQQQALAPLIAAARPKGLTVLGWIGEGVDEPGAEAAARAAGCVGVIREAVKGQWPGVVTGHGTGGASAGPTGAPWIDSNGWVARLAAARDPGAPVWIWVDPPEDQELRPESYLVAVADAEAFGGRWVVSLTPSLRSGVAGGAPEAVACWSRIARALSFFDQHSGWRALPSWARLGVLSDFAGDNETLATEVLNLSTRRGLHYRVLLKDRVKPSDFHGLKAILYADAAAPKPELAAALVEFARSGGTLIVGRGAAGFLPQLPSVPLTNQRYDLSDLGKGRLAVSHKPADFEDPFLIACDTQLLLSYRNDLIRFWNYGAIAWHYTSSPDGRDGVLHVVNYAGRPGADNMGLIVREPYRHVRLSRLEAAPSEVTPNPARVGIELPLPPIPVYAAVELGR